MTNWALDSLIKTVQKYYHKMNFHTGKGNIWLKHSLHVMIMSKASLIVIEEYNRLNSTEDKDSKCVDHQDNNIKTARGHNNTKASSTPKRVKESCAIAEYLLISKITQEIPGRRFSDNKLWENTAKCTVQLTAESDRKRALQIVQESQTEEERLLDRFTDDLYNGTNGDCNDNDVEDGSIDPATMAKTMDVDRDDDIDGNDNDGDNKTVNSGGDGGGDGGGDQNHNGVNAALLVKKCAVNKIVLSQDVIEYAKAELEKLNLGKVRVWKRARRLRLKLMSTAVMESVSAMHNLDEGGDNESEATCHEYIDSVFERINEEIRTGGGHELIF